MRFHHIIELFVLESQKSDSTSEDRDRPEIHVGMSERQLREKCVFRPVGDENSRGRNPPPAAPLNKTEVVGCLEVKGPEGFIISL